MGLTREGFIPESYNSIKDRIKAKLEVFSPGIDLSQEGPDGQLIDIMSFELSQAWNELNLVYNSYNPEVAVGAGLRNIGLISGIPFGAATRSQVVVDLEGTEGTVVPSGSIVADTKGNEFLTSYNATIPASVQVVATLSGPIEVNIGDVNTMVTNIEGWDSVANSVSGRIGSAAQSEVAYRNIRNKTVMRNFVAVDEVIRARLSEVLAIEQVEVLNNDNPNETLDDGTPPNTIHVTVGEVPAHVTDEAVAQVILDSKGLACPTYGTTEVEAKDQQGNVHKVRFSKASPIDIFMDIEILFLDLDFAGAEESIKSDLLNHINSLAAGEDVVWSRLFGIITPYAKAQVNKLEIGTDVNALSSANVAVSADEFANALPGYINITVVN